MGLGGITKSGNKILSKKRFGGHKLQRDNIR